ncbi:acyl-phosphate glycerol-3-phosphate acyltransferase [Sinobaca qinghaiensis]|uniref:Glycerol-3-phosphate acyltransferase n=1 Tax=Sinobaca qinghaiensis TaxID=342944 RepID=A0A419V2V8_9BACL|nr:glycerol-3-phosphate 1-O-acyltransferase PlsY [Sinobaca qinghaiensis]RKD72867.1 acyl-phosphate glycerol-3-phosphate acyltransferase [Sinobaca qinghaiensis]
MGVILSIIIAYLIGSISFSYVIAKKIKKIDIRKHGSGNAGATNTLRVLGKGPAVIVLLLDIAKGMAAVWIAAGLEAVPFLSSGAEGLAPAAAGLAVILGHNWPVYFGFKGGKGVATTIGVISTLFFFPAVYAGIVAIIVIIITRYVSLGSLLFIIGTSLLLIITAGSGTHPVSYILLSIILSVLAVWTHRSNIERLVKGQENKLGAK